MIKQDEIIRIYENGTVTDYKKENCIIYDPFPDQGWKEAETEEESPDHELA